MIKANIEFVFDPFIKNGHTRLPYWDTWEGKSEQELIDRMNNYKPKGDEIPLRLCFHKKETKDDKS